MHDGSVPSLTEVVALYDRGGAPPEVTSPPRLPQ